MAGTDTLQENERMRMTIPTTANTKHITKKHICKSTYRCTGKMFDVETVTRWRKSPPEIDKKSFRGIKQKSRTWKDEDDPDDLEKPDVEVNLEEEKDHNEVIKLLLMGKEKNVRNTGITSVKIKINGVEKVVKALMDTGASINIIPEHMLKIFNRPKSNE